LTIFTVGHSTRTSQGLIAILEAHKVTILADVRSFPRSFTNPQFNQDAFSITLAMEHIDYVWLQKLGGRRKGLGSKSPNICWRNKAFRNFADYMETPQFLEGIDELIEVTDMGTVAIMCAEALYWRCHRSMISDYLKSKGIDVVHIVNEKHIREHEYTQCAKIKNGTLVYHDQ
jgi:uncharacterized protein (DUF488 family)